MPTPTQYADALAPHMQAYDAVYAAAFATITGLLGHPHFSLDIVGLIDGSFKVYVDQQLVHVHHPE